MKYFKRLSDFFGFTKLKERFYDKRMDGIREVEKEYIKSLKRQNPFGIFSMLMGGGAFAFGPTYVALPIITIIFCILTYGTFDRGKEDNPWTFFIGFCLAVIGLYMYLNGLAHELVV